MAQTVFRSDQIKVCPGEMVLKLVRSYEPVKTPDKTEKEVAPVYTGPTVEELQKAADDFKVNWEAEKQAMIDGANKEAADIISKAKDDAFEELKRQTEEAQSIKADAKTNADATVEKAREEADKIISDAKAQEDEVYKQFSNKGYDEGREKGYAEGQAEVERLIDRVHTILNSVMAKREEILENTEQQIVELVVLMTRKVVKVLSENQKNVVISNVVQALKKVKGRGAIVIRVNMRDLKLVSEHMQAFISRAESMKNIQVLEDSSIDPGGCIVETDFGAIDARISSQLHELEQKILEISPVKSVATAASAVSES